MDSSFNPVQLDFNPASSQVKAALRRIEHGGDDTATPVTVLDPKGWPPDYDAAYAWRQAQQLRFDEGFLNPKTGVERSGAEMIAQAKAWYKNHPVDFINHWCDTYDPRNLALGKPVRMPLILFKRQAELVEFIWACMQAQADGLVEKSRDIGASWVCICFSVWLWLFWPGADIGWGSAKQEQVDRLGVPSSLFEKMRMLINWLPDAFKPAGLNPDAHLFHMRCINPETGSTIIGEIGDNIGRGARTSVYFVDEAAHLPHPEQAEASLSDTTRTRIEVSSVSGLGTVFYRKREAGIEWQPGSPAIKGKTNLFIMDYSDHPEKTAEWHDERKAKAMDAGLGHVFAREVERDYAAAAEGIIIPADWVRSAIDAHITLKLPEPSGPHIGGLDVADGGIDRNALIMRRGYMVQHGSEWTAPDTGITAKKAVGVCSGFIPCELQYDAIGVGSGVKAELNRLKREDHLPKGIRFTPWLAGAKVLNPHLRVIKNDNQSPFNRDFYFNLKAQAWWELRMRFERTHRAVTEGVTTYAPDDLISLPSTLPLLRTLQKELSQATMGNTSNMKLIIDKQPEGTKSPNIADAMVEAFWPVPSFAHTVALAAPRFYTQEQ